MDAVHPRVLGYLGRALSLELTAVQQYMTHASLAEAWGDADAAQRFRQETVEEMRHAEAIVQRMLALGTVPGASQLRPVTHAGDLAGLLRQNMVLEEDLVNLYAEAVRFCLLVADEENEAFFRRLWSDEQHHAEDLGTWLRSLRAVRQRDLERATF
ncbi:MAG: ferritin-like domain-containing protein [Prochlorococcaceae cyanobacterium]